MAYREVRMMDIDQVIRRWIAGESIRAVARSTGLDRNTVRRLIRLSEQAGVKPGDSWPDADKLKNICKDESSTHCWLGNRRLRAG